MNNIHYILNTNNSLIIIYIYIYNIKISGKVNITEKINILVIHNN